MPDSAALIWSEIELSGRMLSTPILGVTGTNGKTTTTALLGEMLGTPVAETSAAR